MILVAAVLIGLLSALPIWLEYKTNQMFIYKYCKKTQLHTSYSEPIYDCGGEDAAVQTK